jgi:hypothetical protein
VSGITGQLAPSGEPFGDEAVVLLPASSASINAYIDHPAFDVEPGLARWLVTTILRNVTDRVGHGGLENQNP